MSTGLIIAIVVVALIVIALLAFVMPRARRTAQLRARERELERRRERVAGEHRTEAEERHREAEMAEQKARMAEQEARRERAEAELHQQRADAHERGMADDQLIADHEREKFAGTSAVGDEPAPMEGESEYQRGIQDERRFSRESADDPASPRRTSH
jgi:FtsZ-interacting cell division protein ZipA